MAHLVLENVSKIFAGANGAEITAVENVNLSIADQEFMVLVGPSGCGKSTTLRMVAGLEKITRGVMTLDGRRMNEVPPQDRDLAMVFQHYALYPHMTAYQNIAFALKLRHYPEAELDRRVRETASVLGLSDDVLARKPRALSGGQRQRVALGRAMVRQPKAFLLDEPLSNLDAKMRVQMRTEIAKLHQRLKTTMIYVTHDQVEAMTMGDRMAVMQGGRVQQVAEPLEIYHHPTNLFVAGFMGSPPMNFFHGQIVAKHGQLYFCEEVAEGQVAMQLQLEEEQARKLAEQVGRPMVLGLRPEDIVVKRNATEVNPAHTFSATVEVIEPMGAETGLYLSTAASTLMVRVEPGQREEIHQSIDCVVKINKAHFFERVAQAPYRRTDTGEVNVEAWQTACRRLS